jgi:hypothetical protein
MADGNVLLVEGKDDRFVIEHLIRGHGIAPSSFKIKEKEGINNLLQTLDVELMASDVRRMGIIVDADLDLGARWRSVCDILGKSGYLMPPQPTPEGTIVQGRDARNVGVWLMPDNNTAGLLEHFVSWLIPIGDHLWQQAQGCVDGIGEAYRLFPPAHLIKAQLHTWLAWQAEPGTPLGLAITKKYFQANSAHAANLIVWLRRLFDLPT